MINRKWWEISQSDIPLMEYSNIFLGNKGFFERGLIDNIATFDLVVREIPEDWGFLIFDGMERVLDILKNFRFDENSIDILKKMNFIDNPEIENFYRNFRFSGDLYAMKEGTIFFPGEPIVRITAPLLEANLLTAFLLTAFSYPIRIISKMARLHNSAEGALIATDGTTRLPGLEQITFSVRSSYLFTGLVPTPLFYKLFPQYKPPRKFFANINHAVVKSFPSEREAYRYALDEVYNKADHLSVMIDTYDVNKGLEIFIEELNRDRNRDYSKLFLVVDSGDLVGTSKLIKQRLKEEKYENIKVQVMSNLDEYSIANFKAKGGEADLLAAVTEVINITDYPKLEAVYKIAQVTDSNGKVENKAKLTKGKESYPGIKQVYRIYKDGKMYKDVIGLDGEDLGEPLLVEYIKKGKIVKQTESLDKVKDDIKNNLNILTSSYKKIRKPEKYPITISNNLTDLIKEIKFKYS